MIVISDNREEEFPYSINVGRPDLLEDHEFDVWGSFQYFVRHSDIEIVVNPIFFFIDELINERQGYGGGGFAYTFWFKTLEDTKEFIEYVIEMFGEERKEVSRLIIGTLNPETAEQLNEKYESLL